MRPAGDGASLKRRRDQAFKLLLEGHPVAAAASAVGAHPSSVRRWRAMADGDLRRPPPVRRARGRRPLLTEEQAAKLDLRLGRAPNMGAGTAKVWTTDLVREQLARIGGARFTSMRDDTLRRFLRRAGFRYMRGSPGYWQPRQKKPRAW